MPPGEERALTPIEKERKMSLAEKVEEVLEVLRYHESKSDPLRRDGGVVVQLHIHVRGENTGQEEGFTYTE